MPFTAWYTLRGTKTTPVRHAVIQESFLVIKGACPNLAPFHPRHDVGILHEATGCWTWVLIALAAESLLLIYCAVVLAREALVEDDVRMPAISTI